MTIWYVELVIPEFKKRLLAEPNLTLDKALELALAQESAEQNAAQLQTPSQTTTQVNKLRDHPNPKASNGKRSFGTCHRCGGKHMQKNCPFKEAECHKCKKKGTWLEYAFPRQNKLNQMKHVDKLEHKTPLTTWRK